MRDDARLEFEKRIHDLPNKRIEAEMEEWAYDSEERSILRRELEERRRAKDAAKERRHQDLKRLHWFVAVVSLMALQRCGFSGIARHHPLRLQIR